MYFNVYYTIEIIDTFNLNNRFFGFFAVYLVFFVKNIGFYTNINLY